MSRFDECLKFVLGREGGTSNDPNDSGGLTSRGITQATCAKAHSRGLVGTNDPRALTDEEVRAIYREFYWRAAGCGHLPEPLDLVVFDEAVNCGVGGGGVYTVSHTAGVGGYGSGGKGGESGTEAVAGVANTGGGGGGGGRSVGANGGSGIVIVRYRLSEQ